MPYITQAGNAYWFSKKINLQILKAVMTNLFTYNTFRKHSNWPDKTYSDLLIISYRLNKLLTKHVFTSIRPFFDHLQYHLLWPISQPALFATSK